MSLHATRGWGYGPEWITAPQPKGEPIHLRRIREFDARKAQVLQLLNDGKARTANGIRLAFGWPAPSAWRVVGDLVRTGQLDRNGFEYSLRLHA